MIIRDMLFTSYILLFDTSFYLLKRFINTPYLNVNYSNPACDMVDNVPPWNIKITLDPTPPFPLQP